MLDYFVKVVQHGTAWQQNYMYFLAVHLHVLFGSVNESEPKCAVLALITRAFGIILF